ncbi:RNA-guided endonuclease InsQ/TnpB family protein [Lactobacillus sp. AN1001]
MKSITEMKYHFGLRIRIYPSSQQKLIIKLNSDASRFIYNQMVAIDKELYQLNQIKLPLDTIEARKQTLKLRKNARQLSNHYVFLNDKRIDSLTKSNAIRNYQSAWKMYNKVHQSGTPNFHKKSYAWKYQTSCQYPGKKQALFTNGTVRFLDSRHISVPKLGKLRISGSHKRLKALFSHESDLRIGTVTISKDNCDKFYLSMQLASDEPFVTVPAKTNKKVGIDLNTDNFLTDSEGNVITNPRYYRTIKGKLAKAQRKLSRRALRAKKEHRSLHESKNYQKQRLVVAKLQRKVSYQRQNFLHVISTALIKNHDLVVAEELRSKNMLKNHALAMSISDVGWRTFLQMMEYKASLYGRTFITVDPKNTTQICSDCGFIMGKDGSSKLTLADRKWTCPNCGKRHIRDWNAAKNILAKGLVKIA